MLYTVDNRPKFNFFTCSRYPFRGAGVADGIFQSKLCNRLGHPGLRTVRPASLNGLPNLFNFLFRLGVVQPRHVTLRLSDRPRAEKLLFLSVKACVHTRGRAQTPVLGGLRSPP